MQQKRKTDFIPVITRKETCIVKIKEILYVEKNLRLVNIHTSERMYTFYGKLDDVMQYLDERFYKCHRSCIVNFEKITSMEDGIFFLEGGKSLRVGQNNYQYAKRSYKRYLEQRSGEKL